MILKIDPDLRSEEIIKPSNNTNLSDVPTFTQWDDNIVICPNCDLYYTNIYVNKETHIIAHCSRCRKKIRFNISRDLIPTIQQVKNTINLFPENIPEGKMK